jgi:hypothetical protein
MYNTYCNECNKTSNNRFWDERINNNGSLEYEKMTIAELSNLIHRLWDEHVLWTRLAIISIANNLPDTEQVINRLLNNAADFGY